MSRLPLVVAALGCQWCTAHGQCLPWYPAYPARPGLHPGIPAEPGRLGLPGSRSRAAADPAPFVPKGSVREEDEPPATKPADKPNKLDQGQRPRN